MKKIFLLFLATSLSGCYEVSNGEKLGIITKCAREGIIFKTYECELIRGRMKDGTGVFGKSFHFTVEDKKIIPILEKALDEQQEVKIKYHQELCTLARTKTHDNSFLDEIIVKDNK